MDTLSYFFQFALIAPIGVIGVALLLILIHELGHFAAGRFFGVGVEEFSVGFGPVILSRQDRLGTLWSLRAFPFGGFVKFAGDGDATSRPTLTDGTRASGMDERKAALAQFPIWQRSIVVGAGPLANIVLAFMLFTAHTSLIGRDFIEPVVGFVAPGGAADLAGLEPEDRIVSFAAKKIDNFSSLNVQFESNLGQEIPMIVDRGGELIEILIEPMPGRGQSSSTQASGFWPKLVLQVLDVEPGSEAEVMGLMPGDMIYGYNDQPYFRWQDFADARTQSIGQEMALHIKRDGAMLSLTGTPQSQSIRLADGTIQGIGVFGFQIDLSVDRQRLGLWDAMAAGASEVRQFSLLIFKLPAQFLRQQRSLDDLGGPVRIAEEVGTVVIFAPAALLFLAGLLSLQLGIINLFPIPVLDGGHLMVYAVEAAIRRPLPRMFLVWLYRVGAVILIGFFLFVTANDLARLVG